MTGHRRTARALTLGAGLTLATSCTTAGTHPWPALTALYASVVLAWCARGYQAAHHRAVAEDDWEQRRVLGEAPAPLIPCCMLARHSDGTVHDRRCTDLFHRLTAGLETDHRSST